MIRYIPGGLETVLNDKSNMVLIEQINNQFFNSCVRFAGWDDDLNQALKALAEAGEPEFAENYADFLFCDS